MLSLRKAPTRTKSIARLAEAEEYFSHQWLVGTSFINKTVLNKKFGRTATNHALAKYFILEHRGSNVSRKLTEVRAREIDDLPEDRQSKLLAQAIDQNIEVAIKEVVPEPPTEYDKDSIICIRKENLDEALDWCIEHKKIQLIKPVRILMSRRLWQVFYREKTHRYFAFWPFCLTNWPSALRKIILSGVDYDLNNSIGLFIQEKHGENMSKYPETKQYLENPAIKRQELVDKLGVSSVQAKKLLHATVNGAAITASAIKKAKSSLLEIVSIDQALDFIDKFKALVDELKHVRKYIAPTTAEFMQQYFAWEQQKTGSFFQGTGLIMHDGVDGCSLSTVIPAQALIDIKMGEARGVWDEESVVDRLITM